MKASYEASANTPRDAGNSRSFAARYGRLLLLDGVAPIPRALYFYGGTLDLSPQQVWFVSCILARKWDGDMPYPSLKEIARQSGCSLRFIQLIRGSLCERGLLQVLPRYGEGGRQLAGAYDLLDLFERLESCIASDPHPNNPILDVHDDTDSDNDSPAATDVIPASEDYSFEARYGRSVLSCGIAAVPRALFTHQGVLRLSPQQVWFTMYILSFQWGVGLPFPSLKKMSLLTGCRQEQLHRFKSELAEMGCLRVVPRYNTAAGRDANAYDFGGLFGALVEQVNREANGVDKGDRTRLDVGVNNAGEGWTNNLDLGVNAGEDGRVNRAEDAGVNSGGEGRAHGCGEEEEAYSKEETVQEESHQQHGPTGFSDEQRRAYETLVGVGVFPLEAKKLASLHDHEYVEGWVDYYLSTLVEQESLDNPLGVLVKLIRSGGAPPRNPSRSDLHSLVLSRKYGRR